MKMFRMVSVLKFNILPEFYHLFNILLVYFNLIFEMISFKMVNEAFQRIIRCAILFKIKF